MRILRIFSDKIVQKVNFGQKMKKRKYIFKPIILNRFSLVNRVSSMRIFSNKIVQKLNFEQKIVVYLRKALKFINRDKYGLTTDCLTASDIVPPTS